MTTRQNAGDFPVDRAYGDAGMLAWQWLMEQPCKPKDRNDPPFSFVWLAETGSVAIKFSASIGGMWTVILPAKCMAGPTRVQTMEELYRRILRGLRLDYTGTETKLTPPADFIPQSHHQEGRFEGWDIEWEWDDLPSWRRHSCFAKWLHFGEGGSKCEVKVDTCATKTGNLFIEVATLRDDKRVPSGISVTESRYFLKRIGKYNARWLVAPTEELRRITNAEGREYRQVNRNGSVRWGRILPLDAVICDQSADLDDYCREYFRDYFLSPEDG